MDPTQEFESKLLARLKPLHELTSHGTSDVQQFYSGATVFLTGGSGYLGKHLIEKLFRATKISKIFFLLRSKKGKSMHKRLIEMLEDPLYDLLREQQPDFTEKLVPVSGDVAELRLGLSEKDWNTITEQVDIVFHLAATTRFDESLRMATLINIRGTRETLILGKACRNIRSFVYVSTAYSHASVERVNTDVSEFFYKSPINPTIMIEIAETVDEGRINDITASLINNWPNTYTFTKSIAEELVDTFGNDLPICVVRPAIVACSKLEPVPGWVDMSCIYGASGTLVAAGCGVLHTLYAAFACSFDIIPVDCVNNAIISAGWKTAKNRATGENKTKIYMLSSSSRNRLTFENYTKILETEARNYPSWMMVAYPFTWFTSNSIIFWIYSLLLHKIPAYIADGISVMLGKKRRFAKLAKKIDKMSSVFSYFLTNQWQFDDSNTAALFDSLSKEDQQIFNFDVKDIDWTEYIITWWIGLRKYILKESSDTLYARKKQTILFCITYFFLFLYFYCLYRILCLPFTTVNMLLEK